MNGDRRAIGFDRKIRLGWLDATADWVAGGASAQEIRTKLDLLLESEISGEAARKKTKGVLLRTWLLVPEHLENLRDEGLSLMAERSDKNRLALHWGMVCANYPVVWETAGVVGRLLLLQERVSVRQVRRRLVEAHGERSTIIRASQRIIRSFADWGVLRETQEKGEYVTGETRVIEDIETTAWLLEAALVSSGSQMSALPTVMTSPALFPFDISRPDERLLRQSSRLELHRQGRNEDLISLRAT
ncbi:MAG: hypothetical protein ACRDSJ_13550 [Rubrobacteraceae bacterium]